MILYKYRYIHVYETRTKLYLCYVRDKICRAEKAFSQNKDRNYLGNVIQSQQEQSSTHSHGE